MYSKSILCEVPQVPPSHAAFLPTPAEGLTDGIIRLACPSSQCVGGASETHAHPQVHPHRLVLSLLRPGDIVPIFRDRKPTQEMKPPTLKRQERNYSSAKQSCLWAQTAFLVREGESREESCRAQVFRPMQQAVLYLHQVYCPNVHMRGCTNTCMSQDRYADMQGCAWTHPWAMLSPPVPRHDHGTLVVLTMVEVTSAAPTMGLTL